MDQLILKWAGTFISFLKLAAGSLVGRVMGALGMTWVNFTMLLPEVKTWLSARLDGAPSDVVDFLAACGVDVFLIMIVSAIVARMGFRTMTTALSSLQGLVGLEQGT